MKNILVTGSAGQIGTELSIELSNNYNVIAAIHSNNASEEVEKTCTVVKVDATNLTELESVVNENNIDTIFHLASLLSAIGEKSPDLAWKVNMDGLKNVLDIARKDKIKIFWPSSIAAFGPNTPKDNTPQLCVMDPNTMYGITKLSGELLCNYYFEKFGVDVRSVRYPGLLGYKSPPSQGTTEYAIEIFYEAIKKGKYICPLKENTVLPMLYMGDAINGAIKLMESPAEKIKIRTSYNLAGFSFSPKDIVNEIKKYIPNFKCEYKPDFRQIIADSWPKVIDDAQAKKDWNWKPEYDFKKLVKLMYDKISLKLNANL